MDIFTQKRLEEQFQRIYLLMNGDSLSEDTLREEVKDEFAEGRDGDLLYQKAQDARNRVLGMMTPQNEALAEDLLDTVFCSLADLDQILCRKAFFYGYLVGTGNLDQQL